jgi:hypothetical protein
LAKNGSSEGQPIGFDDAPTFPAILTGAMTRLLLLLFAGIG